MTHFRFNFRSTTVTVRAYVLDIVRQVREESVHFDWQGIYKTALNIA